ncbi:MAG TPA: sulfotransferase [Acidimicrobiia bacterium]|nr:sulfotransferase [Acidimicrobiia bacterium]
MIVYTAIFNNYDLLQSPPPVEGVRYVCITEERPPSPNGWELHLVEGSVLPHPYAQRAYKILAHRVFPEADVSLYLDGTFELLVDPRRLVERYLADTDLALFRHPQRDGVYSELSACADLGKERKEITTLTEQRYRAQGMPETGYLHAAGVLLRRHTDEIGDFNERWMMEVIDSSVRDQPALANTLWRTGVPVATIDEDIWNSKLVAYHPHRDKMLPEGRQYLFMGGNPRSGTTALCDLLNRDRRIILGMERYRRIREEITPDHFTRSKFFSPDESETTFLPKRLMPLDRPGFKVWPEDEDLVREKWNSPDLRYVGDKSPFYVLQLPYLAKTFPGSRFLIAIRDPVSVADSYQRRAEDPNDHWPVENDYRLAIEHWNGSVAALLAYLENHGFGDLFLIDYDTFYSGDPDYLRSLYSFLELEMESEVLQAFETMTADWADHVTRPSRLSSVMEEEVRSNADWERYSQVRRALPMMRDYRLLRAERRLLLDEEQARRDEARAFHRMFDFTRELYGKIQAVETDGSERPAVTEAVSEVASMWRSFWAVPELEDPQDVEPIAD